MMAADAADQVAGWRRATRTDWRKNVQGESEGLDPLKCLGLSPFQALLSFFLKARCARGFCRTRAAAAWSPTGSPTQRWQAELLPHSNISLGLDRMHTDGGGLANGDAHGDRILYNDKKF